MYLDIAILALFILVYSSVAGRVERSWLSGPIVFTIFGLLIGPLGLDLISFKADREAIRTLAELTLALVLFTDAAGAEEVDRLASHVQTLRERLGRKGAVGRELEFVLQEVGRETNTIAAKAGDVAMTGRAIRMKSCVERLREQAANLE